MANSTGWGLDIGDLKWNGGAVRADIADAIIKTSLTQTIAGASTLQLTVMDPPVETAGGARLRRLLNSPLCAKRSTIALDDLTFELTQVGKSGDLITLTFEDYAIAVLRRRFNTVKAAAGTISRVEFCRQNIAKDAPWIAVEGPASGQAILEEIAIGTVTNLTEVTAGDVDTASTSGRRIIPSALVAQYAKDAGFTGSNLVIAIAIAHAESQFDANAVNRNSDRWQSRDRGLWQINDHYHPQWSDEECFDPAECSRIAFEISGGVNFKAWSTYNNGAYLQYLGDAEAAVAATKPDDQPDVATVNGQKRESHWAGYVRIMGEINWRVFADRGRIVIAPDSWLLKQPGITIREFTGGVDTIDFDVDPRKPASTVAVASRAASWTARPGEPVTVVELGPGDDTYLTSQVGPRSLASETCPITLVKKLKALPEPAQNADAGSEGITGQLTPTTLGDASPQVTTMVQFELAQSGDQYVMGGNGPDQWDCSGLVLAGSNAAGASIAARTAEAQYEACLAAGTTISVESGINTCGALLFEAGSDPSGTYGIGHVVTSLGNGQTIEARGTAYGVGVFSATEGRAWLYAALVPGMDYRVAGGK